MKLLILLLFTPQRKKLRDDIVKFYQSVYIKNQTEFLPHAHLLFIKVGNLDNKTKTSPDCLIPEALPISIKNNRNCSDLTRKFFFSF